MKNLSITAELSSIALETIAQSMTPKQILSKVRRSLAAQFSIMGKHCTTRLNNRRQFDETLELNEYELTYENHTVRMAFLHFKPRNCWEVKSFRLVS